ncbi:MAG: Hsp20/alpha crystallin family protein [Acidobacteriota bacterium]
MNDLARWEPFRDLVALQDRMNRLFNQSLHGGEDISSSRWSPPVDIFETGDELIVKAELPEVKREDIDIRVENSTLTLQGERKLNSEIKEDNYHRIERRYGSFSRSFTLPTTVNPEQIKANYQDGILEIRMAKRPESKPRQIQIS